MSEKNVYEKFSSLAKEMCQHLPKENTEASIQTAISNIKKQFGYSVDVYFIEDKAVLGFGIKTTDEILKDLTIKMFEESLELPLDTSALDELGLDTKQKQDVVDYFKLNNTVAFFESQITNVELEQKLNSEQKNNETTESNTNAKPIVGCGASSHYGEVIMTVENFDGKMIEILSSSAKLGKNDFEVSGRIYIMSKSFELQDKLNALREQFERDFEIIRSEYFEDKNGLDILKSNNEEHLICFSINVGLIK